MTSRNALGSPFQGCDIHIPEPFAGGNCHNPDSPDQKPHQQTRNRKRFRPVECGNPGAKLREQPPGADPAQHGGERFGGDDEEHRRDGAGPGLVIAR